MKEDVMPQSLCRKMNELVDRKNNSGGAVANWQQPEGGLEGLDDQNVFRRQQKLVMQQAIVRSAPSGIALEGFIEQFISLYAAHITGM